MRITQVKSANGTDKRQFATLQSIGLRKIGHSVEKPDSPQLQGMVHAVRHLVKVEESQAPSRKRAARKSKSAESTGD